MTVVRPTGVERTFADDEIIVSKTDPRGVITYANDVFLRVSAMSEGDVLGKPHNVIRHPDMPKAVFQLLWDTLRGGHELFAYIVNLAADGAHYWVLAHVTPTHDAAGRVVGYHSSRRTPDRRAVAQVQPIYRELLAVERRAATTKQAVEASSAALQQLVRSRASSYEELVWSLGTEGVA
jgi:PAS domain S-box-containing protein